MLTPFDFILIIKDKLEAAKIIKTIYIRKILLKKAK